MPDRSAACADRPRASAAAEAASVAAPVAGAARAAARAFDEPTFRQALGRFATGVIVVTAGSPRGPRAMTANAFISGSLQPPLIVVSVGRAARMHGRLASARRLGVSILDREQEPESRHFAGQVVPRFSPAFGLLAGVPVLARAAVLIAARIEQRYACGDHTLFVAEVDALSVDDGGIPLVYYNGRYRALQALSPAPDRSPEPYPSFF